MTLTSEPYQPILSYLCGMEISNIKSALMNTLSKTSFIQSNQTSEKCFIENCYAITNSSVFIFVMDKESIYDHNCLSLLGIAIAYDIPVIGVREIGYALPCKFPKVYSTTEIIDRSRCSEYHMNNSHLTSVTTLENVLKVLFSQAIAFHERIQNKCVQEVKKIMRGLDKKRMIRAKKLIHDFEENIYNEPHIIKIQQWPVQQQDILEQYKKKGKQNIVTTGKKNETKIKKYINDHSKGSTQHPMKNYNHLPNKCKIRLNINNINNERNMMSNNINNERNIVSNNINNGRNSEKDNKIDSTQNIDKKNRFTKKESLQYLWDTNRLRSNSENKSSEQSNLRRQSSLPGIATNYLVSSEETKSPKIYHFPTTQHFQQQQKQQSKKLTSNIMIDINDDDDALHLSRICSPIDFRTDEELLIQGVK